MTRSILVVGTHHGAGLTSTVLGLYHALDRQGSTVVFHKPVRQLNPNLDSIDYSDLLLVSHCRGSQDKSLRVHPDVVQQAIDKGNLDELMEKMIANFDKAKGNADIVIMEGLLENANMPYAHDINQRIARALSADVLLVSTARVPNLQRLENRLDYAASQFGGYDKGMVLGAIINHVDDENSLSAAELLKSKRFNERFQLFGAIPVSKNLSAPRVIDLQKHLNAGVILEGEIYNRRVHDYVMFARTVPNAIHLLRPNYCIFSPCDRDDTLMAVTIAAKAGANLSCLVLTGEHNTTNAIMKLCQPLLEEAKLPILHFGGNSWDAGRAMEGFNRHIPEDDDERVQNTKEYFAEHIKSDWVTAYLKRERVRAISPAAFRYGIVQRAIAAQKTIVLPEGNEPRTIVAANICAARGMANCILLGEPEEIQYIAEQQGVTLHDNIKIIDPETIRENYVQRLIELRAHKGMNETLARSQLEDNVMLATMMLEAGVVDGMVSGAVHTTANTIRPPLQIIKTAAGTKVVSSVFFMCLPDQVLVYGDCAIIPNPSEDELAQIAIQSYESAKAFGIEPKVAMISYSTGNSGAGADVEKVKAATDKVRELRPDILIDGPLQYDAAAIESVGKKKAPDSEVAGRATVFIFPDLNTGNTTYKAVQRSANAISMGPVLQGMRKPVNDLSRGALVDDIVYTIAITAVQAAQNTEKQTTI